VDRFPEGAYPAFIRTGSGANVWDVDGNYYVDWIGALGAVPLGYFHPGVHEAIQTQLDQGIISGSLPHPLEEEVAARLVEIIPCAQDQGQVRFVKTGSEACSAAVRIARRATDRIVVIVVGYHGWHDWAQVTNIPHPGIADSLLVLRVPYNDTQAIEDLMRSDKIAAVILEPTLLEAPHDTYLSDVCTLCTLHGAVSIFDEMVTGFRWARAGGQEYFGVVPDLSVFGKGLANGLPLACVVGPERLLKYADVISGTFGGECLSLAAAGAVLDVYDTRPESPYGNDPIAAQWRGGTAFLSWCKELGIPTTGYPVHPKITYSGKDMALFLQETARRGMLMHPAGMNVSAALTSDDMKVTQQALQGAKAVLDSGEGVLEGAVPPESLFRRQT
jgi:glutamate-1-semialdehyde 2,1-aminomutase